MPKAYLFVDINAHRATLLRLPEPGDDAETVAEGRIYEGLELVQDFICSVLDVDYSDADSIVTAAEMQGRDWTLDEIDNAWYVTLRRVPEFNELLPRYADFDGADAPLLERVQAAIITRAVERLN